MKTNLWGPAYWTMLHTTALSQSDPIGERQQINIVRFIKYFSEMIPCSECRNEFERILNESDMNQVLNDRASFFAWTVMVHNLVNKKLGKKVVLTNDAYAMYSDKVSQI
jgi:hypothetical protein